MVTQCDVFAAAELLENAFSFAYSGEADRRFRTDGDQHSGGRRPPLERSDPGQLIIGDHYGRRAEEKSKGAHVYSMGKLSCGNLDLRLSVAIRRRRSTQHAS